MSDYFFLRKEQSLLKLLDGYNIICHNSLMENILHERNVLEVIDKALEL